MISPCSELLSDGSSIKFKELIACRKEFIETMRALHEPGDRTCCYFQGERTLLSPAARFSELFEVRKELEKQLDNFESSRGFLDLDSGSLQSDQPNTQSQHLIDRSISYSNESCRESREQAVSCLEKSSVELKDPSPNSMDASWVWQQLRHHLASLQDAIECLKTSISDEGDTMRIASFCGHDERNSTLDALSEIENMSSVDSQAFSARKQQWLDESAAGSNECLCRETAESEQESASDEESYSLPRSHLDESALFVFDADSAICQPAIQEVNVPLGQAYRTSSQQIAESRASFDSRFHLQVSSAEVLSPSNFRTVSTERERNDFARSRGQSEDEVIWLIKFVAAMTRNVTEFRSRTERRLLNAPKTNCSPVPSTPRDEQGNLSSCEFTVGLQCQDKSLKNLNGILHILSKYTMELCAFFSATGFEANEKSDALGSESEQMDGFLMASMESPMLSVTHARVQNEACVDSSAVTRMVQQPCPQSALNTVKEYPIENSHLHSAKMLGDFDSYSALNSESNFLALSRSNQNHLHSDLLSQSTKEVRNPKHPLLVSLDIDLIGIGVAESKVRSIEMNKSITALRQQLNKLEQEEDLKFHDLKPIMLSHEERSLSSGLVDDTAVQEGYINKLMVCMDLQQDTHQEPTERAILTKIDSDEVSMESVTFPDPLGILFQSDSLVGCVQKLPSRSCTFDQAVEKNSVQEITIQESTMSIVRENTLAGITHEKLGEPKRSLPVLWPLFVNQIKKPYIRTTGTLPSCPTLFTCLLAVANQIPPVLRSKENHVVSSGDAIFQRVKTKKSLCHQAAIKDGLPFEPRSKIARSGVAFCVPKKSCAKNFITEIEPCGLMLRDDLSTSAFRLHRSPVLQIRNALAVIKNYSYELLDTEPEMGQEDFAAGEQSPEFNDPEPQSKVDEVATISGESSREGSETVAEIIPSESKEKKGNTSLDPENQATRICGSSPSDGQEYMENAFSSFYAGSSVSEICPNAHLERKMASVSTKSETGYDAAFRIHIANLISDERSQTQVEIRDLRRYSAFKDFFCPEEDRILSNQMHQHFDLRQDITQFSEESAAKSDIKLEPLYNEYLNLPTTTVFSEANDSKVDGATVGMVLHRPPLFTTRPMDEMCGQQKFIFNTSCHEKTKKPDRDHQTFGSKVVLPALREPVPNCTYPTIEELQPSVLRYACCEETADCEMFIRGKSQYRKMITNSILAGNPTTMAQGKEITRELSDIQYSSLPYAPSATFQTETGFIIADAGSESFDRYRAEHHIQGTRDKTSGANNEPIPARRLKRPGDMGNKATVNPERAVVSNAQHKWSRMLNQAHSLTAFVPFASIQNSDSTCPSFRDAGNSSTASPMLATLISSFGTFQEDKTVNHTSSEIASDHGIFASTSAQQEAKELLVGNVDTLTYLQRDGPREPAASDSDLVCDENVNSRWFNGHLGSSGSQNPISRDYADERTTENAQYLQAFMNQLCTEDERGRHDLERLVEIENTENVKEPDLMTSSSSLDTAASSISFRRIYCELDSMISFQTNEANEANKEELHAAEIKVDMDSKRNSINVASADLSKFLSTLVIGETGTADYAECPEQQLDSLRQSSECRVEISRTKRQSSLCTQEFLECSLSPCHLKPQLVVLPDEQAEVPRILLGDQANESEYEKDGAGKDQCMQTVCTMRLRNSDVKNHEGLNEPQNVNNELEERSWTVRDNEKMGSSKNNFQKEFADSMLSVSEQSEEKANSAKLEANESAKCILSQDERCKLQSAILNLSFFTFDDNWKDCIKSRKGTNEVKGTVSPVQSKSEPLSLACSVQNSNLCVCPACINQVQLARAENSRRVKSVSVTETTSCTLPNVACKGLAKETSLSNDRQSKDTSIVRIPKIRERFLPLAHTSPEGLASRCCSQPAGNQAADCAVHGASKNEEVSLKSVHKHCRGAHWISYKGDSSTSRCLMQESILDRTRYCNQVAMVAEKQEGYFGQSMRTHNHVERKTIPLRSDPNNFSMSRKLPVFVLDLSGPKKSS